jgi:hypothetical protein
VGRKHAKLGVGRQPAVICTCEIVKSKNHLPQIVLRLAADRAFTNPLHCGQQKRDQKRDHSDDNDQFDQRQGAPVCHG